MASKQHTPVTQEAEVIKKPEVAKKTQKNKTNSFPRQEIPHKAANFVNKYPKGFGFLDGETPTFHRGSTPQPPSSPGARLISAELLGGIEQGAAVLPHGRQDHLFPGRRFTVEKTGWEKVGKKRKLEKH